MPHRNKSAMAPSTAAIVLCSWTAAAAFVRLPYSTRIGNTGASFAVPNANYGRSRWISCISGTREHATGDFDPLRLMGCQSRSPEMQGGRRISAASALSAIKGGVDGGAGVKRGGAGAAKGSLNAIKIGIDELGDAHMGSSVEEQRSSAVAKGWDYWKYRVLLLVVALLWGTNFPAVKFVEQHGEVSNATAAFVRFLIAAGASLPFADLSQKEVLFAGMEIGTWISLGYITQAVGLQTTDASVCAFLCSLTVVVVPLLDALTGKGIKRVTVAASFLALVGTGFLELGDAHASLNDLWCVAQAIGFGVAFTRIEHYMEKFPGKSLQLSIGQLVGVAGLTGLWCAYSAGGHLPDFSFIKDPQVAAALGYTGLVTTSLAIWLETVCLEKVPAAEMSVIFSTEPLWATVASVLFLKETMGPNALVGAGVILLACLVAQSEKILELMGMGGDKDGNETETDSENKPMDIEGEGAGEERGQETVHLRQSQEVNEFSLAVLDEMETTTESELESLPDLSTAQEYTLAAGAYDEGFPFAKSMGERCST